jgi:hypothetical protein
MFGWRRRSRRARGDPRGDIPPARSAREEAASRVRYQFYVFGPEARWSAREGRRGRVGRRDVPRASGPSARQPYVVRRPSRSSPRRSRSDARARARRARPPPARTDSAPHIFEVWRWTRRNPRRLETRAASPRTPRSTTSRARNTRGRVGEVEGRTRAPRLCWIGGDGARLLNRRFSRRFCTAGHGGQRCEEKILEKAEKAVGAFFRGRTSDQKYSSTGTLETDSGTRPTRLTLGARDQKPIAPRRPGPSAPARDSAFDKLLPPLSAALEDASPGGAIGVGPDFTSAPSSRRPNAHERTPWLTN